ncbi:MAG: hypothetical protein HY040_01085 [Planctomycetes bacterium]|nr:hypothetical protein [Planctomycetota bacterium]
MNANSNSATNGANGSQSKILWWILGAVVGPLILATVNTVQTTVNRVSALEAEFLEIKHQLGNIERKLDRLTERKN